jgi:hypothetical protein
MPYRMTTKDVPEYINGVASPDRQLAALVDQQLGGWPVAALTLWRFDLAVNGPTTYQFADERGTSLNGSRSFSASVGWSKVMTRDQYYLLRLSPAARQQIECDGIKRALNDAYGRLGGR